MAAQIKLNTILNRTQRFPGFCYGNSYLKDNIIYVQILPHKKSSPLCSHAQCQCSVYDHLDERQWQFLPLLGFMLMFTYTPRRVNCPEHGIGVEHMPWSNGKSPVSIPYMIFLARWARRLSWKEVATIFGVGWRKVHESVNWVVDYGLKLRQLANVTALGVDEIHWGKGKQAGNYLSVVYQLDKGARRLLCVEKARSCRSLERAFKSLGKPVTDNVKYVCTDMWKPYLKVIRERLPQALNILDRFHICSHLNQAVDQVRRSEVTQLGKTPKAQKLKKMRWHLLKKGKRVRGKARAKLNTLLASKMKTATAWQLKEAFDHFWTYSSPTYAMNFLSVWCTRALRSRIQPVMKVARMLKSHEGLIANWFIAKKEYSNAITEGLNCKIRVVTKRAYGYKSFEVLRVALFHNLGGLEEPKPPHRFC